MNAIPYKCHASSSQAKQSNAPLERFRGLIAQRVHLPVVATISGR